ncbi:MAG: CRISPR-associated helicase Cas3' [Neomegalonema sp.]|nr:CRISPR-associated helicase Cas3' [Neomegalonema sp.]
MPTPLFAHTAPHDGCDHEPLLEHLAAVANRAGEFAAKFDARDWGTALGWLHDVGKAKPGFQNYLMNAGPQVPHSGEGAKLAHNFYGKSVGPALAFCIAGHHSGLANGSRDTVGRPATHLQERLKNAVEMQMPEGAPPLPTLTIPPRFTTSSFSRAFFIRMLFSSLVDADFLETERYMQSAEALRGWNGSLADLRLNLDKKLAEFDAKTSEIARLRAEVLSHARGQAEQSTGLFSMTVPTGGGKTLSSLAFALDHAIAHGMERVIYVAPFTSIIEQTAEVFRDALNDDDAVLEHHSAFELQDKRPRKEREEEDRDGGEKLRLAAQNWDRPVIVTTAVQFFESLFANRTSRCRKLHRISRAVIILDEAQTLPLPVLRPCLAAIAELARNYGSSVVLCTATQPAVRLEDGFRAPEALSTAGELPIRELAPEPERLYRTLKRVRVENVGVISDEDLLRQLREEEQVLCIVNNRTHARELFEQLQGTEGRWHLTTAMTAAHRRATLARIREELAASRPVRLIATSLLESGVDISFPCVLRAIAGVDSIAQAAGRCNRSMELGAEGGRVIVFSPENRSAPAELKQFVEIATKTLPRHDDPLSLEAVRDYFGDLLWAKGPEALDCREIGPNKGVMQALDRTGPRDFCFADIAHGFRVIKDAQVPVIIRDGEWGCGYELLGKLAEPKLAGAVARDLQPYTVQIPPRDRTRLIALRDAEIIREGEYGDQFVALTNDQRYLQETGLNWSDPTYRSSESLIF